MHLAEIVSNVNCVAETNGSPGEGLGIFLGCAYQKRSKRCVD